MKIYIWRNRDVIYLTINNSEKEAREYLIQKYVYGKNTAALYLISIFNTVPEIYDAVVRFTFDTED